MAVDVAKLAIQLQAEGAQAVIGQLEGLAASATALASTVAESAIAFGVLSKSMAFIENSISAAAEEEQVFTRMGVAVTNAGVNFQQARPAIEALLQSISDNSTFRVDQLGLAFTRLVQLTGNVGGSMEKLGIVTDFAAGRNIDLETAANLVGRAMNGNAIMLNRMLGLHGSAAQALEILTERYHGNAAALTDTMGGAQAQASNAMHEFEEAIGGVISKEGGLEQATRDWRDVVNDATKWVKLHRAELGDLVLGLVSFGSAIGTVISWIKYPLVGAWMAVNAVMYKVIEVVENIPPAIKLVVAEAGISIADFIARVMSIIPGTHTVIDDWVKKFSSSVVTMAKDAHAAIDANAAAALALTQALLEGDEPLEEHTTKIKKHKDAVTEDTAALIKEADALAKLGELRAASTPDFLKAEDDYAKLTTLVASHTLSLEEQAKAVEALGKLRKAFPVLGGGFEFGGETADMGKIKQTVEQGLALYQKAITEGLVKGEAADKKALKHRAEMFAASAEGQFTIASAALAQKTQDAIKADFLNLTTDLAGTIADTLGAAFKGGFAAAGKVALQGLGNILATMGKNMLIAGAQLVGLLPALSNPFTSGAAMIAVGAILLATGTLLGGIMTGSGASGGGGGGGGVAGAGVSNGTPTITNITLSGTGAHGTRTLTPLPPIHVGPVIGANDGRAQRDILELIRRGMGRGIPIGGVTG